MERIEVSYPILPAIKDLIIIALITIMVVGVIILVSYKVGYGHGYGEGLSVGVGGTCAIQQVPSESLEAAVDRWNMRDGELVIDNGWDSE